MLNRRYGWLLLALALSGCTQLPEGVTPVQPFALERYLGQWYEIARLDHRFERGLEQISARYQWRDDGGVEVINRGFDPVKAEWREAIGRAYPVGDPQSAHLKVSFFGPFYGSYAVFALDPDYRYALVSGPNHDYLWILARTPQLERTTVEQLLLQAQQAGFDTRALIFANPGQSSPTVSDQE